MAYTTEVKTYKDALALIEKVKSAPGLHDLLLVAGAGATATIFARRIARALGDFEPGSDEQLQASWLHYGGGLTCPGVVMKSRPFRAPHYSVSAPGLVNFNQPGACGVGQLFLAHGGVLFLEEIPEFRWLALEALKDHLVEKEERIFTPIPWTVIGTAPSCPCGGSLSWSECDYCDDDSRRRWHLTLGHVADQLDMDLVFLEMPLDVVKRLSEQRAW